MLGSTGSLLLLTGTGVLLLRPRDLPLFARMAGRLAGISVRAMRALRETAEEAIAEGEKAITSKAGDSGTVKEDLRESLSQFESLRAAVTRDVQSIGGFTPVGMIRSKLRGESATNLVKPTIEKRENPQGLPVASPSAATVFRRLATPERSSSSTHLTTGADFIARSVQEAALAKQHERILGRRGVDLGNRGS